MARRIGLLGLYASRNLGDAAIQLAVIGQLRRRLPAAEFTGICPDPDDTRASFAIDAVDFAGRATPVQPAAVGRWASLLPWRVREAVRRLGELSGVRQTVATLDLLVLSGGGQLDEFWGGAWNHPAQLYAWTRIARRRGVPAASLGLGMDVLATRAGRFFCVRAIRACRVRTYRDTGTAAAMEGFGMRSPHEVIPDLAFALDVPPAAAPVTRLDGRSIGIATISKKALGGEAAERHGAYLDQLAVACDRWLLSGARLRFVCSQPPMDRPVVDALVAKLKTQDARQSCEIAETPTVDAYCDAVRGLDVLIASRLHGLILALLVDCPVIAVAGNRKVTQLMRDVGLERLTLPMASLAADDLARLAADVDAGRAKLIEDIRRYNARARAELDRVFGRVAALAGATPKA